MIFSTLPLHPLLVHAPVVLIPLTLIMALPGLFNRRWFNWLGLATVFVALAAAAFSWGATLTGDALRESLGSDSETVNRHADLGEMARNLAFMTFLAVTARWALFAQGAPARLREIGSRFAWLDLALSTVIALFAVAATVWAFLAGHSGALAVWTE